MGWFLFGQPYFADAPNIPPFAVRPLELDCTTVQSLMPLRGSESLMPEGSTASLMPSRTIECPCCGGSSE